jgi:hypothetical protein
MEQFPTYARPDLGTILTNKSEWAGVRLYGSEQIGDQIGHGGRET